MIDVSEHDLNIIRQILRKHVPRFEVRAFGSRVQGVAKSYSDLDLAIVGEEELSFQMMGELKEEFEESSIPFRVEILDWNRISESFRRVVEQSYEIIQRSGDAD